MKNDEKTEKKRILGLKILGLKISGVEDFWG